MCEERRERRYQAYQTLRQLADLTAETMKRIAYSQSDDLDWAETCRLHRAAFENWIGYAESQSRQAGD